MSALLSASQRSVLRATTGEISAKFGSKASLTLNAGSICIRFHVHIALLGVNAYGHGEGRGLKSCFVSRRFFIFIHTYLVLPSPIEPDLLYSKFERLSMLITWAYSERPKPKMAGEQTSHYFGDDNGGVESSRVLLVACFLIWCFGVLQVKIWFQNRRTKWKKHDNVSNAEAAEHKSQQQLQQQLAPASSKRPGAGVVKKCAASPSGASGQPHSGAPGGATPPSSGPAAGAGAGAASGSPFSADEHSNGSLLTADGSVSESGFSEESRVTGLGSGAPDGAQDITPEGAREGARASTAAEAPTPPLAASPCSSSVSPVAPARSPRPGLHHQLAPLGPGLGPGPHASASPQRDASTASPSAADTPTLGATLGAVATPLPRDSTLPETDPAAATASSPSQSPPPSSALPLTASSQAAASTLSS